MWSSLYCQNVCGLNVILLVDVGWRQLLYARCLRATWQVLSCNRPRRRCDTLQPDHKAKGSGNDVAARNQVSNTLGMIELKTWERQEAAQKAIQRSSRKVCSTLICAARQHIHKTTQFTVDLCSDCSCWFLASGKAGSKGRRCGKPNWKGEHCQIQTAICHPPQTHVSRIY